MDISSKLDLPVRLTRLIIFEFTETSVFNEVRMLNDKEIGYQPGISDTKLTVKFIIDKLDEKGVNQLPIENGEELKTEHLFWDVKTEKIHRIAKRFHQ